MVIPTRYSTHTFVTQLTLTVRRFIAKSALLLLSAMCHQNALAASSPLDPLQGHSLLLSSEQRAQIELQRQNYLHPQPKPTKTLAAQKVAKPKSNLPKNLAVSAVIVTPEGRKIVRINGEYQLPKNKNIRLDANATRLDRAALDLNGHKVEVPVGYNYQPNQKTLVKNYKNEPLAMSSQPDTPAKTYDHSAIETKPLPPAKTEAVSGKEMQEAEEVFSERRFRDNQAPAKDANVSWKTIQKMARERAETDDVQPFNEENKYAKEGKVDWATIKAQAKAQSEKED